MNYIEVSFSIKENKEIFADILTAEIAELGFESFMEAEDGLLAYISTEYFNEHELKNTVQSLDFSENINYHFKEIKQKNWNEEWEKNYDPIIVNNTCLVRAPFHTDLPSYPMDVIIAPKMAFGTGHHATTSLMIEFLLEQQFVNVTVLDMGCGSGVLAIVAAKMGARYVTAIDNDEWAYLNTKENIQLNYLLNANPLLGSVEAIPSDKYKIILANINRNILLEQIPVYTKHLLENGKLFLSGFLQEDLNILIEKGKENNLQFIKHKEKNNWIAAQFQYVP